MNFSTWSIKNPIPAIMLFVLLTFAGGYAFERMKIQQFPDVDVPIINVTATLPGAAPNQLETEVARKIEDSIATVSGVKHITTQVYDGVVSITTEFVLEKPTQEAVDDVRSAVASVRGDLPDNVNEPIVAKLNLARAPVLAYTVSASSMDEKSLTWFVENDIAKLLLGVKGVGAVNSVGGVNREIAVELDPVRLQALGATASDISRQLAKVQIEAAGGKAEIGSSTQPLRTIVQAKSAQELAAMSISLSDGRSIRLDQVAQVKDTFAKRSAIAFLDGKQVVGFEIVKSKGASDVEVGRGVRAKIEELRLSRPDIQISESFDFVSPVEQDYQASMTMLGEGALLAVLVVFLFLRDIRATVVAAVALPLSAIPAFIGMQYMGFTINIVTLLSMSLVIGILVDDAIVEVENIVRHLRMGKSAYQAAMEAADEIGLAVIATTFTLIAVFLPTAFMSGIVGKFFKQFGWTATFAIFASLVVARLLTPMMAAYLLKPLVDAPVVPKWADWLPMRGVWRWVNTHPAEPKWLTVYGEIAAWSVRHRWLSIAGGFATVFALIVLSMPLPSGFIPPDDNSQTQVYLELAPGTELETTVQTAEQARQALMKIDHIKSVYTTIGSGSAGADPFAPAGTQESRKAALTIQLDERGARPRKQVIENQIRQAMSNIPGVRVKVGLGGSGEKYQLAVSSDDSEALLKAALALENEIRTIPGVGNIESSAALVRSEVIVRPDLSKMAQMGVTSAAVVDTLRVATVGDFDSRLAKMNLPERQIPIVVRLTESALHDLSTLSRLVVPGARGPVMLGQIADLTIGSGPSVIDRYDRRRNVQLNIELAAIALGDAKAAIENLPSFKNIPASVRIQEVGDAEANAEMARGFAIAMGTGILCIYIVLVLLFKAFMHPMTILFALPLSLGGAFVALKLSGSMLSMPALIGLLMLMGISTKNSILLVDYAIETFRKGGVSRMEAILDACHKRARPIIMTSIAMGAGMVPIVMGLTPADSSFRAPMAWVVIGGLVSSTLLSLIIIPPIYTLIDDLSRLAKWLLTGRKTRLEVGAMR